MSFVAAMFISKPVIFPPGVLKVRMSSPLRQVLITVHKQADNGNENDKHDCAGNQCINPQVGRLIRTISVTVIQKRPPS